MGKSSGNNLTTKILAVVLAAILWLYVMNEQNPPLESSFTVPLQVRNSQAGFVVADLPPTVRVKLRGPRSIIASVTTKDIVCDIDLKGLTEGKHNVNITTYIPPSLELLEVYPDKAPIRVDAIVSRILPVEVRFTGVTPAGSKVTKTTITPEQVRLTGPRPNVNSVEKVITAVDMTDKTAPFQIVIDPVPINLTGKEVDGLAVSPDKVSAAVEVTPDISRKTTDIRPFTQGELPEGYVLKSVTVSPARVDVTGPADKVDKLEFIITEPVNLSNLTKSVKQEVTLQIREGLTLSRQKVEISIEIAPR